MCGICGALNLNGEPVSPAVVRAMAGAIAHRGPDGEGFYTDGVLGLGHRRLAIIDLSPAGAQPMASADGRYVIVYNGEVYNFMELRAELAASGSIFNSRSDSEVVLRAFEKWGENAVVKFNGMFAFAVWDKREKKLFLARDRYGVKPLYYAFTGGSLVFASEIKAILKHPDYIPDVDREALAEYFTFQNIFTDKTLFKGIKLLPPGTFMRVEADGGKPLTTKRYWDYSFREPADPKHEAEYIEELDRLFAQAVNRQIVADVDVGAYLSGGMDSGSITSVAAKSLPYIKTFTIGFDLHSASGLELGFDEREKAESMSYLFSTEHYEMVLKSGDMERVMAPLIKSLEDPRVGQCYPNFYAARLAGKFCKVVLSGSGGDELFGGYPWRYYRSAVNSGFEEYVDKYYAFWQRLIPNGGAKRIFAPIWNEVSHVDTRAIFRSVFNEPDTQLCRPEDYINHSLYFEAKTFLHGLLLVEDKLSMAHGLETRVPFLDNDLVDFAMNTPANMKLGNLGEVVRMNENEVGPKTAKYFERTRDGKMILRKAMEGRIPQEVSERIKQGFSAPDASWFKGESIEYVRKTLYNPAARIYEYFDREAAQGMVDEHLYGKENKRLLIWSLLSFETWLRTFVK